MIPSTPRISAAVLASPQVPAATRSALRETAEHLAASAGGVTIATCHRLEVHVPGPLPAPFHLALPDGAQVLDDDRAIAHLVSLAVGLESAVLAEDQVLHQLRLALAEARARGLDPTLERVLAHALRAGRLARSWRPGPPRSLADHALDVLETRLRTLADRRVLVVGAGEMGRLAASAARRRAARVSVTSRTEQSARLLAGRVRAAIAAFDPGSAVTEHDGVVVALGGPWAIAPATVDALLRARIPVVDVSAPSVLPERLLRAASDRIVTVDELGREQGSDDGRYRERLVALRERTIEGIRAWLASAECRETSEALMDRAERERRAELDRLWRRLPSLGPEERVAIEGMTRHLAARLLQEPLERLGRDRDGQHERAARELFGL